MEPATDRGAVKLRRALRGYDRGAVDRLLGELETDLDEAEHAVADLTDEIGRLEAAHARRACLERTLRDSLIQATAHAKRLAAAGEREAAQLLDNVRLAPIERRAALEREREQLSESLRELETTIRSTRVRLRLLLEHALEEASASHVDSSGTAPVESRGEPATPTDAEVEAEAPVLAPVPPDSSGPALPRPAAPASPPRRWRGVALGAAALLAMVAGGLSAAFATGGDDAPAPTGAVAGTATTVLGSSEATSVAVPPSGETMTPEGTPPGAGTVEEPAPPPGTATTPPDAAEPKPPEISGVPGRLAVELVAARGDCWLQVRRGSPTGQVLFEGFLLQGDSVQFSARRLWARMGAPANLTITVDGTQPSGVPAGTSDVLFTRSGVKVLAIG